MTPAQDDLDWDAMAVVGRVARAHGNRGEVIVNPETDFVAERFRAGAVMYARRSGAVEAIELGQARVHQGRPVIRILGVDTMNDAEAMAGVELRVPIENLRALPAGQYYRHELRGCRVETVEGDVIGEVDRVEGPAASSYLVVVGTGGEVLIPLAEEICVVVDVQVRRVVVKAIEGLLDLNEPGGRRRRLAP